MIKKKAKKKATPASSNKYYNCNYAIVNRLEQQNKIEKKNISNHILLLFIHLKQFSIKNHKNI